MNHSMVALITRVEISDFLGCYAFFCKLVIPFLEIRRKHQWFSKQKQVKTLPVFKVNHWICILSLRLLAELIMNVSTVNFVFRLKIVRFIIILPLLVFVGFELARARACSLCLSVQAARLAWLGFTWLVSPIIVVMGNDHGTCRLFKGKTLESHRIR